jgi:2-(1,2-epoxy-1,2-dihydrophenyl)acetyl-CoA isomerase
MSEIEASPDLVGFEVEPSGVAHLTLNKPSAANAMDLEFLRAFHGILMRCRADPDIRAVLLAGNGKNFCAGGDVRAFARQGEHLSRYLRETVGWMQLTATALIELPAPVVAAVQGAAAGGAGFGIVCASDFVVAGETARFFGPGTGLGMTPDAGTSVTLVNLVGLRRAMEILLRNRPLSAQEAADMGLITTVVPDDEISERAYELASELAAGPQKAIAATKRLLWEGIGSGVAGRLPAEAWALSDLSETEDVREGLAAFVERRPPNFRTNE